MTKDNLLSKVKPETLDVLLDALSGVMEEMKVAEPNRVSRLGDAAYAACLCLNNDVLMALKEQVLKGYTREKIEG